MNTVQLCTITCYTQSFIYKILKGALDTIFLTMKSRVQHAKVLHKKLSTIHEHASPFKFIKFVLGVNSRRYGGISLPLQISN